MTALANLCELARTLEKQGVPGPYRAELGDEVRRTLVGEGSVPAGWLTDGRPLLFYIKGDEVAVQRGRRP